MIISENVKLNICLPLDNRDIERELFARSINPIRWSVVSVSEQDVIVNVSYVKES